MKPLGRARQRASAAHELKETDMDALHVMLRSMKPERKSGPRRPTKFRVFLDETARLGRWASPRHSPSTKRKANVRRCRKG